MLRQVYPSFRMTVAGGQVTLGGPVRIAGYAILTDGAIDATLDFYLDEVLAANRIWPEYVIAGDKQKGWNFADDLGTIHQEENIIIVPGGGTAEFFIRAFYKSKS